MKTESRNSAAIAAIHSLEARLAGLRRGESTVINGTTCTAVSLNEAELLTRYKVASARTAELSKLTDARDLTVAEFNAFEFAQDTMRESRAKLAEAGRLDLIGGA